MPSLQMESCAYNDGVCFRLALSVCVLALPALAQRVVPPWNAAIAVDRASSGHGRRQTILNPMFPEIRQNEFVRRVGSTLMLGNRPFRFNGNNTYYLQAEIAYGRIHTVEETLDKMADLGMPVTRANAHNDHPPEKDPAAIQTAPGVFVEASLVALDQSIEEARKRNIRMILKLTNNWDAYGGIRRYVAWQLGRNPGASEYSLFYTDETIRQWFRNYIRMILERRNTVTGNLYKDEPTILAWELGNELRNPTPGASSALVAWMEEMARFIKSVDSNHLVADGGEGFDDDPGLYAGLSNRYAVSGGEGCSYHRMVEIPAIDMASYHLYAATWGLNDTSDVKIWIQRHEEIARAANKVAYFGEYGRRAGNQAPAGCSTAPGRAFDPERAQIFAGWLTENAMGQGSAGHMAWQLIDDGRVDCEGYQIYCPRDGATCDLLRQFSLIANAAPAVVTSSASYEPVWLAPESLGSLFGQDLAGARLMIVDSLGREQEAPVVFAGESQINFLVPAGLAMGGAVLRMERGGQIRKTSTLSIVRVAPGLFSADATGTGLAAAIVTTARADGSRITELATVPVDLSLGETVVSLFGTGWRGAEGASPVEVTIGALPAAVLYSGPQPEFPGLDQMNVRIPPGLAGRGQVEIVVKADGRQANPVQLLVR
ncbi:MAG: cellulase family glycosylhydrolase [Acidobacteriia bacterium]|nr:cellulase family glycosylhydrolase [Terriglobia bacterium]